VTDPTNPLHRPSTRSPSLVLGFRLLLLFAALGAAVTAVALTVRDAGERDSGARYVCPMHPQVTADAPGECPICRMALEPARGETTPMARGPMASMSDEVEAVENVRKHNVIDFVRRRTLLPHMREMRGPAVVEDDGSIGVVFYKDQVDVIGVGEIGTFSLTRAPEVTIAVRRTADAPAPWDGSTSRILFRSETAKGGAPVRPGDVGWVELARKSRDVLAVPASAVLQSPEGPYVLAWTGVGYKFEKRPIEIGETFAKGGFTVVVSGLRANERVVSRATFFLDAERRLASRGPEGGWGAP
jgi:hypothetical protein